MPGVRTPRGCYASILCHWPTANGLPENACQLLLPPIGHEDMVMNPTFGRFMRVLTAIIGLCVSVICAQAQDGPALRTHLSFEYGGQLALADMKERFGNDFNLGSQFEILHTRNLWLAGIKGYFIFGNTVKEDVIESLRTPEGFVIGNDGGPATIVLRERGFFVGPYVGKLFGLFPDKPHAGIKVQVGAGLLQHHVRIQDDTRTVEQLTGDYRKGYDRLANGIAGYLFAGYQHLDPNKRINFLAGFDLTYGATRSRRDFDFNLGRPEDARRNDLLVGFRIGWILPITTGIAPETIYY